jgi:hypothetical protein
MRKIEIGSERFTEVFAKDTPGAGGACHEYRVTRKQGTTHYAIVKFQKGPVKETVANGCFNEDLIAIVIDRLQGFQNGDFPCRENAKALGKLEEALHWLDHRTKDRQKRGVEGTFKE